jgi:hypothetical protein
METVNILGTPYSLIVKKYDEDEEFERRGLAGYCNGCAKEIVVCDMATYKGWERESEGDVITAQKESTRHEMVHAFLNESGLGSDTMANGDIGWAKNEEMVDWFALQGPKIYAAWKEAGAI